MKRNTSFTHHFRNGVSILFGILLLSVSLSSCLDETWVEPSGSEQGIKMYIRIPAPTIGQTRAGETLNDDYVDPSSVYVFVLSGINDNDRVLQVVNAVAGTEGLFYAKLTPSAEAKHVYIVANAKDIIEEKELTKITLGQLKNTLIKTAVMTGDVISGSINPQPMFGTFQLPAGGIVPETTIGKAGDPVMLARTTSKITIINKTGNDSHFKLLGANLVNAPKLGYIVSGQATTGKRYPTGVDGKIDEMISTPSEDNKEEETVLYCFESAEKIGESTYVIIKANYLEHTYYYRLNLNNKEVDYPLLRNNHYIVTIAKVDKAGYTTIEDAMKNPSNIDYVVNVVDETGRNMVSNGEYYLAVSQTEYYYVSEANGAFTEQEVAIVTHNAPESAPIGKYTTSSADIIVEDGPSFSINNGNTQSFPLKVTMRNGITYGTITLELGDLERVIEVYHIKVSDSFHFGALFDNFIKKGYIAGKVDKEYESWITLSDTKDATGENQHSSLENKEGNIYVSVDAYLGDKNDLYRDGSIDLFREDEKGNARVKFHQKMFDVYTPTQQQAFLRPFTYIATFHRWDQTGERIIRVDAKVAGGGSTNVNWKAFVITGNFIRLSKTHSKDDGVGHDNFYGAGDNTKYDTATKVEALQVTDGTSEISSRSGGEPIYFRVGLTGILASANAQPRYGLIALIVNTGTGQTPITRYIYVRQGEAADYLMRPQDAITNVSGILGRPQAKKICPFNLTDTRGGKTSDLRNEGDEQFVAFAKYPSQAGYLYQPTTRYGWWADKLGSKVADDRNYEWSPNINEFEDKYETCPSGYRRPGEKTGTDGSNIATSEMRQSMWLYPQTGQVLQTQNFIMGYMADGYYDRREMWNEVEFRGYGENPSAEKTNALTAVGKGAEIAYMGVLAFNPYSVASIFMPSTGFFRGSNDILNQGKSSGFWTRTRNKELKNYWSVDAGYLTPGDNSSIYERFLADNYKHDGGLATSIRCIKDE